MQAALTSSATFAAGAALPMLTVVIVPDQVTVAVTAALLVFLRCSEAWARWRAARA